jgi:hypothetical protein
MIRLAIAGAVAVALVAGAAGYRSALIDKGYDKAMQEVAVIQAERQREQQQEYTRLVELVKTKQDAYEQQKQTIDSVRNDWRIASERVRSQAADLDRRIAEASSQSVRDYAKATGSNLERCIGHVERFAAEAAANAATARALSE